MGEVGHVPEPFYSLFVLVEKALFDSGAIFVAVTGDLFGADDSLKDEVYLIFGGVHEGTETKKACVEISAVLFLAVYNFVLTVEPLYYFFFLCLKNWEVRAENLLTYWFQVLLS